jgi:hypothetical protein
MILLDHHHPLQKYEHMLLPHRTFETFLNRTQKGKNAKMTALLTDTPVKML